jgi:hypothetical protein
LAHWNKNGGLTCSDCTKNELIENNLVSCDTCEKPRPLEANYIVLELYSYNPITPIPMTDGLVLLDLKAVEFLFRVFDIPHSEEKSLLERLVVYHEALCSKDKINIKEEGKEM